MKNLSLNQNATQSFFDKLEDRMIPLYAFALVLTITIISNLIMAIALVKTNKKTSGKLFIALCVCDVLFLTFYVILGVKGLKRNNWLMIAILNLGNFFQILGVQLFWLITILRYRSLVKPFSPLGSRFIWSFIFASCLVSFSYPALFDVMLVMEILELFNYFEAIAGSFQFLSFMIIVTINMLSYCHQRKLGQGQTSRNSGESNIEIQEEKSRIQKLRSIKSFVIASQKPSAVKCSNIFRSNNINC